jgi:hypothetical protein
LPPSASCPSAWATSRAPLPPPSRRVGDPVRFEPLSRAAVPPVLSVEVLGLSVGSWVAHGLRRFLASFMKGQACRHEQSETVIGAVALAILGRASTRTVSTHPAPLGSTRSRAGPGSPRIALACPMRARQLGPRRLGGAAVSAPWPGCTSP